MPDQSTTTATLAKNTNFQDLKPILNIHIKSNQVPFLAGYPGIGKSAILKELAQDFNTKIFVLSVNQLGSREDLTGARMIQDEKTKNYKQVFFPHAVIQDAIDYATSHPKETPFLFLDEINRTTVDVTSAVMAIITERRVGTTLLPDNLRLVAAGNDNGNINVMDIASNSRMQIYHVKPDVPTYFKAEPNLNTYIKQVLSKNPELLTQIPSEDALSFNDDDDDADENANAILEEMDNDSLQQITVPRTLSYLSDFLNNMGLDGHNIPDDLGDFYNQIEPYASPLNNVIHATIGNTVTAEKIFETIQYSIDSLTSTGNNNTKPVDVPTPKQEILDAMYNDIESDDDVDEMFSDPNLTQENFIDTYLTLIQSENYKKLNFNEAIIRYHQQLGTKFMNNDMQARNSIIKPFSELYRNGQIAKPVIDEINRGTDTFAGHLQTIIAAAM